MCRRRLDDVAGQPKKDRKQDRRQGWRERPTETTSVPLCRKRRKSRRRGKGEGGAIVSNSSTAHPPSACQRPAAPAVQVRTLRAEVAPRHASSPEAPDAPVIPQISRERNGIKQTVEAAT